MNKAVKALITGILCMLLTAVTTGCGSMPASGSAPAAESATRLAPAISGDPISETGGSIQIQRVSFDSVYLKKKMNMNVYLPKEYNPSKKYAVLYLIHGYGGHENDWERDMELPAAAEKVFASGKVESYIIVTPDIENSYAINSADTVSSSKDRIWAHMKTTSYTMSSPMWTPITVRTRSVEAGTSAGSPWGDMWRCTWAWRIRSFSARSGGTARPSGWIRTPPIRMC